MKTKIKSMKQELKEMAQQIRSLKSQRKTHVSEFYGYKTGYVPGLGTAQHKFRINHIAYCLLRGRQPEEIENKWKDLENDWNKYVWKMAYALVDKIKEEYDEAVRVSP